MTPPSVPPPSAPPTSRAKPKADLRTWRSCTGGGPPTSSRDLHLKWSRRRRFRTTARRLTWAVQGVTPRARRGWAPSWAQWTSRPSRRSHSWIDFSQSQPICAGALASSPAWAHSSTCIAPSRAGDRSPPLRRRSDGRRRLRCSMRAACYLPNSDGVYRNSYGDHPEPTLGRRETESGPPCALKRNAKYGMLSLEHRSVPTCRVTGRSIVAARRDCRSVIDPGRCGVLKRIWSAWACGETVCALSVSRVPPGGRKSLSGDAAPSS